MDNNQFSKDYRSMLTTSSSRVRQFSWISFVVQRVRGETNSSFRLSILNGLKVRTCQDTKYEIISRVINAENISNHEHH